ncbi:DUF4142 domain-containing protein [Sphingobacterium siyangense]|uniref:DUF4142 domain-containing protein n=1 Tax=Sphingobacterium siyangense TaxID=459529 RepID=UPI001965CC0E|nr:DUF4142 domain-containing protein [Sphingobacterium siyangense]QRY55483.1 DUF4142 domain-containing protein [Sphingobacterium siyangense]
MKSNLFIKKLFGSAILVLAIATLSCKNENKPADAKKVAEEENERKFDDTKKKEDDAQYLVEAAAMDLKEIEIGKLAQQKSIDPDIKAFGKMLEEDHMKSSAEVKKLAQLKDISLPAAVPEDGQKMYKELDEKTGLDFDKKFADMMVDGHQKAIDKMTKAAEEASDKEISAWASSKIPTLAAHLEHAKSLKEKIKDKK